MSLREEATNAWLASISTIETEARETLAEVLEPFDTDELEIFYTEIGEITARLGFTDNDVYLMAVLDEGVWHIDLVDENKDFIAGPIVSLIHLGEVLPPLEPGVEEPSYPEWFQRWNPDAYKIDDRVMYLGEAWESTIDINTWKPGEYGWIRI